MPAAFARMYDGTIADALAGTEMIRSGLSAISRFMFCASTPGIEHRREHGHVRALLLEPALDRVRPGGAERVLVGADDHADVLAGERPLALAARPEGRGGERDGNDDGDAMPRARRDADVLCLISRVLSVRERASLGPATWPDSRTSSKCIRRHTTCRGHCQTCAGPRARRSRRQVLAKRASVHELDREDPPAGSERLLGGDPLEQEPAAARAISASGWRAVVRLNASHPAMSMSSKPTIESSSGTRTPRRRAASSAPNATTSFAANTAVGRGSRREQVETPLVAARMAVLADAPQARVERQPRPRSCSVKPELAVPARRGVLRAGDERDPPMPVAQRSPARRARPPPVLSETTTSVVAELDLAVQEHHRARRSSHAREAVSPRTADT